MHRTGVAYLSVPDEPVLDATMVPSDIDVVARVVDEDPAHRSALGQALQRIASGEADTLFLARLSAAAGSLGELVRLLDWLRDAGADLVAADLQLDTGDPTGRHAVALLREVERWGREPDPARRPRGRPGLASGSPALAQRVALMREDGLSLQAIAGALNAEGVPTPRGGTEWRASSVQATLGYRRPRPPAPGAPPPHPRHGKPPGPPPPPHRHRPPRP